MSTELPDAIRGFLRTVKKAQCFKEKTRVYAPTCYGQCLPAVTKLISDLNEIFKGSTIFDAQGSWFDPDTKQVETEPIKVIEIAEKCTTIAKSRQFAKAIMEYGIKARQKALSIDQRDFFIARSPEIVKAYVKAERRGRYAEN